MPSDYCYWSINTDMGQSEYCWAVRVSVTHCGHWSDLYPPLRAETLSHEHKAHLIGWASLSVCQGLCQTLNIRHSTVICWPSLYLLSLLPRHCLSATQYLLCSQPKHFSRCTPLPPPPLILSLSDDTGPQGFLPDMIWDLDVAKGRLSTLHTLLCTRVLVCFWKYFSFHGHITWGILSPAV